MRGRRVATWLDPESPPSLLREAALLVLAAALRARAARAAMDEAVAAITRLPATGRPANAADDRSRAAAVAALLAEAIPEATLSATGMEAVLRCMTDVEGRVLGAAAAAGVDSEDVAGMAAAIHQVLPPNLAKHAVEDAAKATAGASPAFSNPPCFLAMYREASRRPTTVYLAAALEYIVCELLWMCRNVARDEEWVAKMRGKALDDSDAVDGELDTGDAADPGNATFDPGNATFDSFIVAETICRDEDFVAAFPAPAQGLLAAVAAVPPEVWGQILDHLVGMSAFVMTGCDGYGANVNGTYELGMSITEIDKMTWDSDRYPCGAPMKRPYNDFDITQGPLCTGSSAQLHAALHLYGMCPTWCPRLIALMPTSLDTCKSDAVS